MCSARKYCPSTFRQDHHLQFIYDPGLTTPALKLDVYYFGFLTLVDFFRPKSDHCLTLPLSHSVTLRCQIDTWNSLSCYMFFLPFAR